MVLSPSPMAAVRILSLAAAAVLTAFPQTTVGPCQEDVTAKLWMDPGHPWRPPFGLERVGKPLVVAAEMETPAAPRTYASQLSREYFLVGFHGATEAERHSLQFETVQAGRRYQARASFSSHPSSIALEAQCRFGGQRAELARISVPPGGFEAEAGARPAEQINPVDLGTILVPADWLLLRNGQSAAVEVAAIDASGATGKATVRAWFAGNPGRAAEAALELAGGRKGTAKLVVSSDGISGERDDLHVSISGAGGKPLWQKRIRTMLVANPPRLPAFGATEMKLRYDAPISLRDSDTGKLSQLEYAKGWDPSLEDVVVTFPSGARFVFWRGSSYVPFWAGKHNTGLSYEWAETGPPPDGFTDSVEPLMDKELRYGRVRIVESTPARVHVRWTYQSCDFLYKVWGDLSTEDFYFYPDGFGTRTLTLRSAPGAQYEVSEFIILTPAAAYPLDVLPRQLVDLIYVDGEKHTVNFPYVDAPPGRGRNFTWTDQMIDKAKRMPVVYRVRINTKEDLAAVYFNPLDATLPGAVFSPFFDRGYLVTPNYWGSHWPLARGKTTGSTIDDRFFVSPAHNSVMSWASNRPGEISTASFRSVDSLGRSKPMTVRRWTWMVGMTGDGDSQLLDWARSFTEPASLELRGAQLEFEAYVPERRAFRLRAESGDVAITIKPGVTAVNPVFEIANAGPRLLAATLEGRALGSTDFAWDGSTFWLNKTVGKPAVLELRFGR